MHYGTLNIPEGVWQVIRSARSENPAVHELTKHISAMLVINDKVVPTLLQV